MTQRETLLVERDKLKKEHLKRHKTWMDAFNKRNALLPKFHTQRDGTQMAEFVPTIESVSEYANAEKAEREASAKLKEIWNKILEINTKLQK